ncbi:hypothetical protein [Megalodesulfovibrio gigas]|uniref:hypothetical protein n=1 Tax=Megalodesulfovibrio gigas TaxID=879 RepID=UPI001186B26D|nr:hypothetical protein [Megalodesulfovibrio gigas]
MPTPPINAALVATNRVSTVCDRYLEACRRHRPALAVNEWLFLCDVLGGDGDLLPRYTSRLRDSLVDGIHRKWDMDDGTAKSLLCRLEDQSFVEDMATIEVVDRYWGQDSSLPPQDALKLALG